tara:strand:- start:1955 stop:3073 length:1119 start_codon:yes stop_codon:yes gene_type:complete
MVISKKTEIIVIATSLNLGGSEKQAVKLANNLYKEGKNVHFISLKKGGALKENLDEKISVIEYNLYAKSKKKYFPKVRSIIWFFLAAFRVRKEIKNYNIVVISYLFHASLFGYILSFGSKNLKHITSIRSDRFSGRKSRSLYLRELVMKLIVKSSSYVVFNSQISYKKYSTKFKITHKSKVINNFSDDGVIKLDKKEIEPRIYKGIFVGRLDELKNIDSLIISFAQFRNINISLDIYGDGSQFGYLQKLIEDNNLENTVSLKGIVKNIIENSEDYNFLILTSFHEGFPNVIFEAMKNYLFVITTDVGDVKELIRSDTGIIINGFSKNDIATALHSYIAIPYDQKLNIIKEAKKIVEQKTDFNSIIKSWLEIV